MLQYVSPYDIIAGLVTVGLLVGILLLAILGTECPEEIKTAFTVAIGWTFRGGVQAANEFAHRNEGQNGHSG